MRVLLIVILASLATSALASDGVLEINQVCAVSAGCFSGDSAGFPVEISAPGSYRLTSNLDVDVNGAAGIQISSDDVTLDLSGFRLVGTNLPPGDGIATTQSQAGVVVRNGTVRSFEGAGIRLGPNAHVENMTVAFNTDAGIVTGADSLVLSCRVRGNGEFGTNGGLALGSGSGYRDVILSQNDPANVTAGKALGESLCDGEYCSGPRMRRFYLTIASYAGNQPAGPSVCDDGFHFASLHEIRDPSNLRYDTSRGRTEDDSGEGPPTIGSDSSGWVRTGSRSETTSSIWINNCGSWSSAGLNEGGSAVKLTQQWGSQGTSTPASSVSPWDYFVNACSDERAVWCVEDAR